MKIAIPKQVWDKLNNKTQEDLKECAGSIVSECYTGNIGHHEFMFEIDVFEGYYKPINDEIYNQILIYELNREIKNLKDIEKEYNNLKLSVKNIKSVFEDNFKNENKK